MDATRTPNGRHAPRRVFDTFFNPIETEAKSQNGRLFGVGFKTEDFLGLGSKRKTWVWVQNGRLGSIGSIGSVGLKTGFKTEDLVGSIGLKIKVQNGRPGWVENFNPSWVDWVENLVENFNPTWSSVLNPPSLPF